MIVLLSLLHALDAGRDSGDTALAAFWIVMVSVALFTLLYVYVMDPWSCPVDPGQQSELRSRYTYAKAPHPKENSLWPEIFRVVWRPKPSPQAPFGFLGR